MFDTVLFPTDGSEGAAVALDHVLDLADGHDATVHVLNVVDTTPDSVVQIRDDAVDDLEREGERIVRDAADRARQRGVDAVTDVVRGEPYRAVLDYADSHGVDVVVMPTHGRRGLERLLLGSTTERVVRRADVPVLTIRPDEAAVAYPYEDVLIPTDGSDCATAALETGLDVAAADGAAIHLLSVVSVTSLGADVRSDIQVDLLTENAEAVVEDASALVEDAGVELAAATVGYGSSIHAAVLSYVEENDVDLVVIGTHGRSGFDRYMLGSVTEQLIRTSPVPVLTVRTPDEAA